MRRPREDRRVLLSANMHSERINPFKLYLYFHFYQPFAAKLDVLADLVVGLLFERAFKGLR